MGRRAPGLRRHCPRREDRGRRRPRLRRLLAGRHRGDGRALAAADRRRRAAPARRAGRRDADAPHRGRRVGRRGADAALRRRAVELRADRDRRQSLGPAAVPGGDAAPIRPGLQLLLPRVRRRDLRHPRRGAAALARGQRRPRRRPHADHARLRVQRPRRRRAPARRRPGRVRARRARADQHRHRPARPRLSRRPARGVRPARARCSSSTRPTPSALGPAAAPRRGACRPTW